MNLTPVSNPPAPRSWRASESHAPQCRKAAAESFRSLVIPSWEVCGLKCSLFGVAFERVIQILKDISNSCSAYYVAYSIHKYIGVLGLNAEASGYLKIASWCGMLLFCSLYISDSGLESCHLANQLRMLRKLPAPFWKGGRHPGTYAQLVSHLSASSQALGSCGPIASKPSSGPRQAAETRRRP